MALRSAAPDRRCIHPGCWECQARVCPRTRMPCWAAHVEIASPAPNENWPWRGSVASGFISFSGVTMLNSRAASAVSVALARLGVPNAVPK